MIVGATINAHHQFHIGSLQKMRKLMIRVDVDSGGFAVGHIVCVAASDANGLWIGHPNGVPSGGTVADFNGINVYGDAVCCTGNRIACTTEYRQTKQHHEFNYF